MAPLFVFGDVAIVQPTVAMPGDLVPGSADDSGAIRGLDSPDRPVEYPPILWMRRRSV